VLKCRFYFVREVQKSATYFGDEEAVTVEKRGSGRYSTLPVHLLVATSVASNQILETHILSKLIR
jgi:hypothetical protein